MKNKIVRFLLPSMIVYLCAPILSVYGKENINLYAGVVKDIGDSLVNTKFALNSSEYAAFTTANINIRNSPSLDAEVLDVIPFNSEILIFDYNDEWAIILYELDEDVLPKIAYINKKYISSKKCKSTLYSFPNNRGFKSFMPYTAITHTSSLQYKLQNNMAYTGNFGIRQVNGRYCVAIGTAFDAEIGSYIDLILENETVIECIVSDIKAQEDTLQDNITTTQNGCVSEFIVDLDLLYFQAKYNGDISSCCSEWKSPVKKIKIYDKNVFY